MTPTSTWYLALGAVLLVETGEAHPAGLLDAWQLGREAGTEALEVHGGIGEGDVHADVAFPGVAVAEHGPT